MNIELNDRQRKILEDLANRVTSDRALLLQRTLDDRVDVQEMDDLCGVISDEFLMHGIDENFEPNAYGKEVERLLDAVNKFRLK